jgi:hypothetical protein
MGEIKSAVLKPQELADRWQVSLSKIYEDNSAGKLPHLKTNRNRFPIKAIEAIEDEAEFDERDIPTPLERKLKRRVKELEEVMSSKNKEIFQLKQIIAKVQMFTTEFIYEDRKD